MRVRVPWLLTALLASAVLAAGCGGGSKKKTTTPTAGKAGSGKTGKTGTGTKPSKGIDPNDPGEPGAGSDPIANPDVPETPEGPTKIPDAPKPDEMAQKQATVRQRVAAAEANLRKAAYAAAETDAKAALNLDEFSVEAMAVLAKVYYMQKKYERASYVMERAEKAMVGRTLDDKVAARMQRIRGLVALMQVPPDKDKAVNAFREASSKDAEDASTWHNLGTLLVERKAWDDAVQALERAVGIQARFAKAHVSLGAAYRGQSLAFVGEEGRGQREGLLAKAQKHFDEALKIDPALSTANYNLGLLFLDAESFPGMDTLQRLAAASKAFGKYQQSNPAASKDPQIAAFMEEIRKDTEKETKRLERERLRKEKEAAKAKKAAEKAAGKTPPP